VKVVHKAAPGAAIAFNTKPAQTPPTPPPPPPRDNSPWSGNRCTPERRPFLSDSAVPARMGKRR